METNNYETLTLSLMVKPKGSEIYDERATIIEMADEGGGPFIMIKQCNDSVEKGEIRIDPEEWPEIQSAIKAMLEICKQQKSNE